MGIEISQEDLDAVVMERTVNPVEKPEQTAHRLIVENAPRVALGIVRLANGAASERVRLDASKYVIDRALGRIGESRSIEVDKDALQALYESVVIEASESEAEAIRRARGR